MQHPSIQKKFSWMERTYIRTWMNKESRHGTIGSSLALGEPSQIEFQDEFLDWISSEIESDDDRENRSGDHQLVILFGRRHFGNDGIKGNKEGAGESESEGNGIQKISHLS
jgi:hypothetical protein